MRTRSNSSPLVSWAMIAAIAAVAAALFAGRAGAQFQTGVPTFTPMPTVTPRPTPSPRVFRCSCSTSGQPVVWAGQVIAPSFFTARELATGQCLAALGAKPGTALIPTPGISFIPVVPTPVPIPYNPCALCACN